ncbi:hypothetical protein [Enterococcus asini]|uniref:hypothetical protein n=1 Tax=Enterococcus asini TaxID=57732 RepID=UPI001E4FE045|nr:hypothetical protein [Enterococcus asini]
MILLLRKILNYFRSLVPQATSILNGTHKAPGVACRKQGFDRSEVRMALQTKKLAAGQAARGGENEKVLGLFVGMDIEYPRNLKKV